MAYKQIKSKKALSATPAEGALSSPNPESESPGAPSASPVNPPAAELVAPTPEDITMDTMTPDSTAPAAADGHAVAAEFSNRAKQAMEKGTKMIEEMNAFGKGNVEALVESGKIAVKGIETMGQDAAEFTRKSVAGATEAMKTLAATRSPTEFLKLQSDYARAMFDAMVAETSRSTEAMIKLANDVAQPISNRVALAAEKVKLAA